MVTLFKSGDLILTRVFRAILEAMSRPGGIVQLPAAVPGQARMVYLFHILETLLDQESSHYLIDGEGSMQLDRTLYEATKSPRVRLEEADFIIAPYGSTKGAITRAKRGRPEYPDLSATVIYLIDSLSCDRESIVTCCLQGPGIADRMALPSMEGFDQRELFQLSTVNRDFPLGVDALFVDPDGRLMAIPRSTQIHLKDSPWPT